MGSDAMSEGAWRRADGGRDVWCEKWCDVDCVHIGQAMEMGNGKWQMVSKRLSKCMIYARVCGCLH